MAYAVMLGSDFFVGTTAILSVEIEGRIVNFFRIREVYRARSEGSYLAVDVDIKDSDGVREVKLFKNNPVVSNDVDIHCDKLQTIVTRRDGEIVINIVQLDFTPELHIDYNEIQKLVQENRIPPIDAVIKITGEFFAGDHHLKITDNETVIDKRITTAGNLAFGVAGIRLTDYGFGFG